MLQKYTKLHWTEHSKAKMRQYGLSKSKLINLIYKPERKELGIVPGTMALMQTNKSYSKNNLKLDLPKTKWQQRKSAPGEIWLMYKDVKSASGQIRKIISAWRYPGISKPGESIPIPKEIKLFLENSKEFK